MKMKIKLIRHQGYYIIQTTESSTLDADTIFKNVNLFAARSYYQSIISSLEKKTNLYKTVGGGGSSSGEYIEFELIGKLEDIWILES